MIHELWHPIYRVIYFPYAFISHFYFASTFLSCHRSIRRHYHQGRLWSLTIIPAYLLLRIRVNIVEIELVNDDLRGWLLLLLSVNIVYVVVCIGQAHAL